MKKPKTMYDYVCTRCKKNIQLPVKLDPSRPIYCEDCLAIIRGEKPELGAPHISSPPAASSPSRPPPIQPSTSPIVRTMGLPPPRPFTPQRQDRREDRGRPKSLSPTPAPRTAPAPSRPRGEMIVKKETEQVKPMSLEALLNQGQKTKNSPLHRGERGGGEGGRTPSSSPPSPPPPPKDNGGTLAPGETISFD